MATSALSPVHIVVMGVSGAGKSTIGEMLSERLGVPFRDGDDLHPESNIAKMAQGIALTDEDRWPWLGLVGSWLRDNPAGGVIGCSSLKRSYRDRIREAAPDAIFIHVHGDEELLYSRMSTRDRHFMPTSLLDSQLATLEPLADDEAGTVIDIDDTRENIVANAYNWLANER
ncbi:gluconokinase [Corynebacterium uterequi]|uniref:Gluconokinase n=1 Tax=Corynebacterium uterequi TaxID=1072256 RepID=A0A0G3HEL6_9CORY|nr:gluconokinase [Corynebacterium uterequi]AKK11734.1 carbohydrate kinase, thermoresistant glucokinase family [Corynebacterium uterequi]